MLLEAAQQLPPDVRVWVASDGDETRTLKQDFADDDRIEWLGPISADEKCARLAGASVFCAPSLGGESFGVVLLEAMAAGTPIVASDISGYALVARNGADALLVEPHDVDALADGLTSALAGGDAVRARVESGRERVNGFSMESLADLYIEMYERLLHES